MKIREKQFSEPAGTAQKRTLLATRVRELPEGEALPEDADALPEGDTSALDTDWQPVTPQKLGGLH